MAYQGKIYDRSPLICAAGKHPFSSGTVKERLQNYTLDDQVNALKHEAHIPDKEPPPKYKWPTITNKRHLGVFCESYPMFHPPVPNRFQTVINDLKETSYHSYWTKKLGASRDHVGNLPLHIHPRETTFGNPTPRIVTMKELINPDKTYDQVLREYIKGHDLYKKTHGDYYVNERKTYNFLAPPYEPNKRYGGKSKYDRRGIWLKGIMNTATKNKFAVSDAIQADFQAETTTPLGECKTPNKILEKFPDDKAFGKAPKECLGVPALLTENSEPAIKIEINEYMSFINTLRAILKKRFNKKLLSFADFFNALKYYDKDQTGWIPFSVVYEISLCYKVKYDKEIMQNFLKLLKILKNDHVDYTKFVGIINWQEDFPEIGNAYHVTPEKSYYRSNYKDILDDMKCPIETVPAGIPTIRFDLTNHVPPRCCKADLDSLGGETLGATIIYPSVYTSYGCTFFDFFEPRPKEEIRKIFMKIGYVFDDDDFEKLWKEGLEIDKTGFVCVETFKVLLNKYDFPFDPNV